MRYKLWLLLCVLLMLLPLSAQALEVDYEDAFRADELWRSAPADAKAVTRDLSPDDGAAQLNKGLGALLRTAAQLFPESLGQELKTLMSIMVIAALCSMLSGFAEERQLSYIQLAGILMIAAVAVTGLGSLLEAGRRTLGELFAYSKVLVSAMAVAGAATGEPTGAMLRQAVTMLFSDVLLTMYERLLFPLLYVYAGLITLNAALPRDILGRLASLLKWMCNGLLTVTLVGFTTYLAVSGTISGQADAVAAKAAKLTLAGTIPVVGRIISDAAEAVLVGASVMKSAIGIFGLVAVLGTVLSPCLLLGLRTILFKLGGAVVGTLGNATLSKYVDGLSGLFSMLLGMLGAAAFLVIISVISGILAGGGM